MRDRFPDGIPLPTRCDRGPVAVRSIAGLPRSGEAIEFPVSMTTSPGAETRAHWTSAWATAVVSLLLLLWALPAVGQTDPFICTTNDGAITITGYTGPGGAVTIPSAINGLPVTDIGDDAFQGTTNLSSITLLNGVASIGWNAFQACRGLTNVAFPDSLTNIDFSAFSDCTGLTNIAVPSGVTGLGSFVFGYCTNLLGIYFRGNAPEPAAAPFVGDARATVFYLRDTTGWDTTFGGLPAVLWNPMVQTAGVRTNQFGFAITGTSDMLVIEVACTNLADPIWVPVGTSTLAGGAAYFSDAQWTNYPARFYRLRAP
jgi:hypothetical protein